jgi:hypothetical protein
VEVGNRLDRETAERVRDPDLRKARTVTVVQAVISLVCFWGGLWLLTSVSGRWWVDLSLSAAWVLSIGPILKRLRWFPERRKWR